MATFDREVLRMYQQSIQLAIQQPQLVNDHGHDSDFNLHRRLVPYPIYRNRITQSRAHQRLRLWERKHGLREAPPSIMHRYAKEARIHTRGPFPPDRDFECSIDISLFTDSYSMDNHRRIRKIFGYTFRLSLVHLPLSASVALITGLDSLSFTFLADIYLLFITFSVGTKGAILLIYRYICNLEKNKHRVVIIGYTPSGLNLHRYFTEGKSSGYHFSGFFDNNTNHPLVMGDIERMKRFCIRENVNEIFYALPYDSKLIQEISSFADNNFIRFGILQDVGGIQAKMLNSNIYDNNLPVLSLRSSAEKRENIKASYQKALSVLRSLNL